MASMTASTDFRRSNHERSHSESSVWIDDYLNADGLDTDDLLDLRSGGVNLLAPFADDDDLQSALSHFIPECAFSEFDAVEPVDIETVEAEQLSQSSVPHDTTSVRVPEIGTQRQRRTKETSRRVSENVFPDPVHSGQNAFASPSLPVSRCNKIISPKKASTPSPRKWMGAHQQPGPSLKSPGKSKPKTSDSPTEKSDKVRLEGVLVSSHNRGNASSKKQKIVSQALLDKLKAASKKAARQSILISTPVTQQPAKRYFVSLDHDYCVDMTKGEKDDLEVQPMELEPEDERAVARIEVLPDLSLAARELPVDRAPLAHDPDVKVSGVQTSVNHPVEVDREQQELELCANVVNEEVVTSIETGSASSDSGIDSFIRTEEDDFEGSLRKGWTDGKSRKSRRSSPSSSDCSSIMSVRSRRSTSRRNRGKSSSRRRGSRSRSPSLRRTYSSSRRRAYSRDSSPDSNSGSEDRRYDRSRVERRSPYETSWNRDRGVRRERKNIWASTEEPKMYPRMPPLNKSGQKTIMQSALETIERGGDRQVLYVGQIQEGTTRNQIREKFDRFGPIAEVSLHFRETGENYAFVTFHQPKDAYFALENAASLPDFKLCFGGRRQFCGRKWSDLDNDPERAYHSTGSKDLVEKHDDFDSLLSALKTASKRRQI
ncbi:peroxisome proliferator-activated receptor gamma coactivator-related protein 1 [Galendromus occidentalis]|uniref:Peroxisome proliferator-activated receptor gamma coactivator-related protein 1 n=1 Tax=Galendromus occidentalis TaxID=34638 RepID=A0AAJ7PAN7_9ACAR|nr:peroxisome proliferator-activated receptor gamma coactivator-related protein 1 [Galendromus occidentalis]